MDIKIGSPTFYTLSLKSIHNINTCFPIIASNAVDLEVLLYITMRIQRRELTQWSSQVFMMTAGPSDLAGFILAPVYWNYK